MNKRPLICGIALVLLFGCKHGRSIVGTWTGHDGQGQETMMFGDDNKATYKVLVSGVEFDIAGTYNLKDNQLEKTAVSVDMHATDPSKAASLDRFKATLGPRLLTKLNSEKTSTITWKSDDEFVETSKTGKPETFTRNK